MTSDQQPSGLGEVDQSPLLADPRTARRPGTRAADGFERVQWTVEDVEAMARAGLFDDGAKVELIEGELLPMPPKGDAHEDPKNRLVTALAAQVAPTGLLVGCESSFRLNRVNWCEPDIIVYPSSMKPSEIRGPDALLVIEIASSSVRRDRELKGPVYARCGVPDYWIVDTERRVIIVHRGPKTDGAWTDIHEAAADEPVRPLALPEIAIRLDELDGGGS